MARSQSWAMKRTRASYRRASPSFSSVMKRALLTTWALVRMRRSDRINPVPKLDTELPLSHGTVKSGVWATV